MTRKDYQLIADSLKGALPPVQFEGDEYRRDGIEAVALGLAERLQEENPRFDRDRFLKACGL